MPEVNHSFVNKLSQTAFALIFFFTMSDNSMAIICFMMHGKEVKYVLSIEE